MISTLHIIIHFCAYITIFSIAFQHCLFKLSSVKNCFFDYEFFICVYIILSALFFCLFFSGPLNKEIRLMLASAKAEIQQLKQEANRFKRKWKEAVSSLAKVLICPCNFFRDFFKYISLFYLRIRIFCFYFLSYKCHLSDNS